MRDQNNLLRPRTRREFGKEAAEISFIPIEIGFINQITEERALRRPAILDDRPGKFSEPFHLKTITRIGYKCLTVAVHVNKDAAIALGHFCLKSDPPTFLALKAERNDYFWLTFANAWAWLIKATVAHLLRAKIGQRQQISATIRQS